jgi:hypothetical protein
MAKAIKKLDNGLSIRYLKKEKRYFLTYGVMHIKINGMYNENGYETIMEAEEIGNKLIETNFVDSFKL